MTSTGSCERPALAYRILLDGLGKNRFREATREYARRGGRRNPERVLEAVVVRVGRPRPGPANRAHQGRTARIVVAQRGRWPLPVVVRGTLADGPEDVFR